LKKWGWGGFCGDPFERSECWRRRRRGNERAKKRSELERLGHGREP